MKARSILLALLALVLALGLAAVARAQPLRPAGAIARLRMTAATIRIAGLEIETSASGKGIMLHFISMDADDSYWVTISDTSFIDLEVITLTAEFKFGHAPLTTILRAGRDDEELFPGDGDFKFNGTVGTSGSSFVGLFPIFIPPGKFVTIRPEGLDTPLTASIGFTEIQ